MKNLLLLILCGFPIGSYCQVNTVMPPEADSFYNNAMQAVKPQIKNFIEKNANNLKDKPVNPDSLSRTLSANQALKNVREQEIKAIAILIMVQASKNADANLKELVMNIQKSNDKGRKADGNNSIKLEKILNYKSEIASEVSLLMGKLPGFQDIVLDNLR